MAVNVKELDPTSTDCERIAAPGEWELSPRCTCGHETEGHWLFEHQGALWEITPGTQDAKDDWLTDVDAPGPTGEAERVEALRWRCFGCDTIQRP